MVSASLSYVNVLRSLISDIFLVNIIHTAGPTERTSVNGSRNIPEHVYEEQSLLMHESQYNKKHMKTFLGLQKRKEDYPKTPQLYSHLYIKANVLR